MTKYLTSTRHTQKGVLFICISSSIVYTLVILLSLCPSPSSPFIVNVPNINIIHVQNNGPNFFNLIQQSSSNKYITKYTTKHTTIHTTTHNTHNTALNSFFFGGTSSSRSYSSSSSDSCELVAVKIDRTSANSRRIGGSITVRQPAQTVWDILTDYDDLSTHVPNLVESKTVPPQQGPGRRRLYQKGAQKIVGFEVRGVVCVFQARGGRPPPPCC